jgi:hypothetical protein
MTNAVGSSPFSWRTVGKVGIAQLQRGQTFRQLAGGILQLTRIQVPRARAVAWPSGIDGIEVITPLITSCTASGVYFRTAIGRAEVES